ncbi:unnamed protein product [Rotaria magnacalcarata]
MSENEYFCQLCINSSLYCSFNDLYTHINVVHCNNTAFKIRCELSPLCGSIYKTLPSYKSHIYKHHRELIAQSFNKEDTSELTNSTSINSFTFSYANDNIDGNIETSNDSDAISCPSNVYEETMDFDYSLSTETILEKDNSEFDIRKFRKYYTGFLLELREDHMLSQQIITSITSHFSLLFTLILKMITATRQNLSTETVTIPVSEIEEIFKQIAETLQNVAKNEYQFINSCKEFFQFEEPKKVQFNEAGDCGYIVPIKNSIKQFLNKPDVINLLITNKNETISSTKRDTDLLLTYRDGVAASSNKLLHKNKSSFLLQLYSDDISVTNPLGPKKDEKKLSLFYYIIDDMPPIVRSLLSSIGFLGICLTKFLSNTTYRRKFFETMINDLNTLQTEGLIVSTSTERLYFTLNLIAADNLAANDYGGFQKNFSNGYFCRMCYMSYALRSIPITDISFRLRSEESHEQHLQKALQSNDFIFGIQRQSDFSSLIGFHPIKSLPFDIMHDFSEGTCMIIVKSILKEFSMRRILTYAQIENRFESFIYGQNDEPNRPPPVRQKHLVNNLISGSAAQKLLLFQVLPLIFYDVIDRLNDLMPIYKCLREIVSIVFLN